MKRQIKLYCIAIPIAFLWDLVYNSIVFIYQRAAWLDEAGAKWLQEFVERE
jgi:hypothetical protein